MNEINYTGSLITEYVQVKVIVSTSNNNYAEESFFEMYPQLRSTGP